nr:reverse transcriptase domain-containing protein [Tanacetum cinerariifolium]
MIRTKSLKEKKRKAREVTEVWMNTPITFPQVSAEDVSNEPIIIEAEVEGYVVRRVYVDERASVEVMFKHCFKNLSPAIKARLSKTWTDMVGFAREVTKPLGKIKLEDRTKNVASYTIYHSFNDELPTPKGIATSVTRSVIISECIRLEKKQVIEEESMEKEKEVETDTKEVSMKEEVLVNPTFPDQLVIIGRGLSEASKSQLKVLPKNKIEIFAWEPPDMTGVPWRIIKHTLNINPFIKPMCQKQRILVPEKSDTVARETPEVVPERDDTERWTLLTNEASSLKGSGAGLVLISSSGVEYTYALHLTFKADVLSKLASVALNHLTKEILVEVLNERSIDAKEINVVVEEEGDNWMTPIMHLKGSGAGLVLISSSGVEYTYALHLTFVSTNNEAEYEALLLGLRIARNMKIQNLEAKVDCKLVISQINGSYVVRIDNMIKYLAKAKECISCFKSFSIKNILRNLNQKADVLSKLASVALNHLTKEILVEADRRVKIMIVAIDYFTKWIEAKPLARITGKEYYNKKVRLTSFKPREFVFQRNEASKVEDQVKLAPNWEGPYRITEAYQSGSYKLQTIEDKEVPRTWHAINLCKCYL